MRFYYDIRWVVELSTLLSQKRCIHTEKNMTLARFKLSIVPLEFRKKKLIFVAFVICLFVAHLHNTIERMKPHEWLWILFCRKLNRMRKTSKCTSSKIQIRKKCHHKPRAVMKKRYIGNKDFRNNLRFYRVWFCVIPFSSEFCCLFFIEICEGRKMDKKKSLFFLFSFILQCMNLMMFRSL